METPQQGLRPFEQSTSTNVPRATWMLRQIQKTIRLMQPAYDSSKVLVTADKLDLPTCLSTACFVPQSNAVYFTVPEERRRVYGRYIPNPEVGSKTRDSSGFGFREVDGDIMALASTANRLFILSVRHGRRPADAVWRLDAIEVQQDFVFSMKPAMHTCTLSDMVERTSDDPVSLVVTAPMPERWHFYISMGEGAPLYFGRFRPNQKSSVETLQPLGSRAALLQSRAPLAMTTLRPPPAILRLNSNWQDRLLLAHPDTGALFRLHHGRQGVTLDDYPLMWQGARKTVLFRSPVALVEMTFQTSYLDRDLDVPSQTLTLKLVADPTLQRIFSFHEEPSGAAADCAPLLGGDAPRPDGAGEDEAPANLLQANIGSVNRLCVIHDACILFGTSGLSNWRALLLPRMVRTLKLDPFYKVYSGASSDLGGRVDAGTSA